MKLRYKCAVRGNGEYPIPIYHSEIRPVINEDAYYNEAFTIGGHRVLLRGDGKIYTKNLN